MTRTLYRALLWLHPAAFRQEFADEMLWIFDQATANEGAAGLFFDGLISLSRQWLLRSNAWKIAVALGLAFFQVTVGGRLLISVPHRYGPIATAPPHSSLVALINTSSLARQPLTVGMVMVLALFVLGGLTLLIIGLTYWARSFATRVRSTSNRVARC